jgi:hypothetical protein
MLQRPPPLWEILANIDEGGLPTGGIYGIAFAALALLTLCAVSLFRHRLRAADRPPAQEIAAAAGQAAMQREATAETALLAQQPLTNYGAAAAAHKDTSVMNTLKMQSQMFRQAVVDAQRVQAPYDVELNYIKESASERAEALEAMVMYSTVTCAMNFTILVDPVLASNGRYYERKA